MRDRALLPLALLAAALATAAAAEPCRPIAGIEPWIRPGSLLLLGEIHGTVESPAFAGDVVCHAARAGLPVTLALELPIGEQEAVDALLAAGGGDEARAALLAAPSWSRGYQDGRNSVAMLELIERAARLRAAGPAVRVALFDPGNAGGGQARDRGMAARLLELAAGEPGSLTVVLTGNLHSRTGPGMPGNADYEPMGYLVARESPAGRIGAFREAHGGGTGWVCAPDCGVRRLGGRRAGSPWRLETGEEAPPGHDGWYRIGKITASPPARLSAADRAAVELEIEAAGTAPAASGGPAASVTAAPGGDESARAAPGSSRQSGPLSAVELEFQGRWQGYDHRRGHRAWSLDVDGRAFRAEGAGEWYEGRLMVTGERLPAGVDFVIERCRCAYLGSTSKAIFDRDGRSLMVAAAAPGNPRPAEIEERGAQLLRFAPR